jgi:hypothetical protein
LAHLASEGLKALLSVEGIPVEERKGLQWLADLARLAPDAVVVFDRASGIRLLSQQGLAWLHERTIVVFGAAGPLPSFEAQVLERAAALVLTSHSTGAPVSTQKPTFAIPAKGAAQDIGVSLVEPLSIVLGTARTDATDKDQPLAPTINEVRSIGHPVWIYWEGDCPEWIAACRRTILAHAPDVRLLDRQEFVRLRDRDLDIDIDRLQVAHRADFIRAFLLARYGGLWLDSDCVVVKSLAPLLGLLDVHDFIEHRDRQGLFPNGFIGARPGSAIAGEFYRRICGILRLPPLGVDFARGRTADQPP